MVQKKSTSTCTAGCTAYVASARYESDGDYFDEIIGVFTSSKLAKEAAALWKKEMRYADKDVGSYSDIFAGISKEVINTPDNAMLPKSGMLSDSRMLRLIDDVGYQGKKPTCQQARLILEFGRHSGYGYEALASSEDLPKECACDILRSVFNSKLRGVPDIVKRHAKENSLWAKYKCDK